MTNDKFGSSLILCEVKPSQLLIHPAHCGCDASLVHPTEHACGNRVATRVCLIRFPAHTHTRTHACSRARTAFHLRGASVLALAVNPCHIMPARPIQSLLRGPCPGAGRPRSDTPTASDPPVLASAGQSSTCCKRAGSRARRCNASVARGAPHCTAPFATAHPTSLFRARQ